MNKNKIFVFIVLLFSTVIFGLSTVNSSANCSFPNVDNCDYSSDYNNTSISDDIITINNSTIKLNHVYLNTLDSTWNISNSSLEFTNIIVPESDYNLIINLEDSTLKLTQPSDLVIQELNFTGTDSNLWVSGTSSADITINNINTSATSNILVDNPSIQVTILGGDLTNLYLIDGDAILGSEEVQNTININNIYGFNPYECENDICLTDSTGSLIIEGADVFVENIILEQVFVQKGSLTISDSMYVKVLGGDLSGKEGTVILDTLDKAQVNEIQLANLNLIDTDLTISGGGEIYNLNSDNTSSIIYEKEYESDYYNNNTLTLRETVELSNLQIIDTENYDSTVELYATGTIDNINYDADTAIGSQSGTLYLHNGSELTSDYVYLDSLVMERATYNINDKLSTNNLYMDNSTLTLNTSQDLTLETLYLKEGSEIIGINDITLENNNPNEQSELFIDNALLSVNNLTTVGTDITIYVDDNEYIEGEGTLNSGINASESIDLTCDDNDYCGSVSVGLHDTSDFNLEIDHTYIVVHAEDGIYIPENSDGSIDLNSSPSLSTTLPEWFSICLSDSNGDCTTVDEVNGDNDLYVTISRDESYEDIVSSSSSNNAWTEEIAKSLDAIIADGIDEGESNVAEIISQLDLLSDVNTISSNISSLAPIEPNVFISNTHNIAHSLLSLLNLDVTTQANSFNKSQNNISNEGILWVRNGYSSVNSSFTYAESNQFDYYLVQSGVNLLSWQNDYSKFGASLSAGLNLGETNSNSNIYNIDSVGYDVALSMYYYLYNYYINLSSIAIKIDNSNTRVDFANNIMDSGVSSQEIFNSLSIGKVTDFGNVNIKNALFVNSGIVSVNDYQEEGTGALSMQNVCSHINEYGTSAVFYPTSFQSESNKWFNKIHPYLSTYLYYRDYNSPALNTEFLNTSGNNMYLIGDDYSSVVFNYEVSFSYTQEDYSLVLKIGREVAISNYNKNYFTINYLLSL